MESELAYILAPVKRRLEEAIEIESSALLAGSIENFPDYMRVTGYLNGLKMALDLLKDDLWTVKN